VFSNTSRVAAATASRNVGSSSSERSWISAATGWAPSPTRVIARFDAGLGSATVAASAST
jgi:hypothetical protein